MDRHAIGDRVKFDDPSVYLVGTVTHVFPTDVSLSPCCKVKWDGFNYGLTYNDNRLIPIAPLKKGGFAGWITNSTVPLGT